MYKIQLLLLLFSAVCSAKPALDGQLSSNVKANEVSVVADGMEKFSRDFFGAVAMKGVNLVFSPFSISAVFAMLKIGTRGQTSQELQQAFHYPDDPTLLQGFQQIFQSLDALKSSPDFSVTSANRVYVDDKFQILQSYENQIQQYFGGENGASVVRLDLNKATAAAAEINAWVEKVTRNKIRNLISPQDLSRDPKLVLVNAIYFLGQWLHPFRKEDTSKQDFFLSDTPTDKVQVDMMHQDVTLQIKDLPQSNAQVVALPYKGGRFELWIYLPNTRGGLSTFNVKNLPSIPQLLQGRTKQRVRLSMPKFKIETTLDLTQSLQKLGVRKIFGDDGDFSGIVANNNPQLFISKAIHKAFIVVDEKGTEATAATGVVGGITSVLTPPPDLKIDHPFGFQIVDTKLQLALFSGAVWRPQ